MLSTGTMVNGLLGIELYLRNSESKGQGAKDHMGVHHVDLNDFRGGSRVSTMQ